MKNFIEVIKKYAVFSGRASRKEYWLFCLWNLIIGFVIGFVLGLTGNLNAVLPAAIIYLAIFIIPSVAVTVRRLHDIGRSGWWLLILFVPYIGPIILITFYCFDSQSGDNKYGPNPKALVP